MKELGAGILLGGFGLVLLVVLVMSGGGASGAAGPGALSSTAAIPAAFREWITRSAAQCPQETPALLAAQLWAESGFRTDAVSEVGAQGPAQFMPGTWATWGRDDDGNGAVSPYDIGDAVMAQGRFMCSLLDRAQRSGYPGGTVALALAGYNAGWGAVQEYGGVPPYKETTDYVVKIQAKAAEWTAATPGGLDTAALGSGAGAEAVRRAAAWVGTPYSYAGGTPDGPTTGHCYGGYGMLNGVCDAERRAGFDCSSLVQMGWWPFVHLPRTADDQYRATAGHSVALADIRPGDLLFFSDGGEVSHVVMYAGDGKIVQAPSTGKTVEIRSLYTTGLVGITRPAG